jgi:hypothetical protein
MQIVFRHQRDGRQGGSPRLGASTTEVEALNRAYRANCLQPFDDQPFTTA